jgi:hypothetical protein
MLDLLNVYSAKFLPIYFIIGNLIKNLIKSVSILAKEKIA